jgi:hypothetical protein
MSKSSLPLHDFQAVADGLVVDPRAGSRELLIIAADRLNGLIALCDAQSLWLVNESDDESTHGDSPAGTGLAVKPDLDLYAQLALLSAQTAREVQAMLGAAIKGARS